MFYVEEDKTQKQQLWLKPAQLNEPTEGVKHVRASNFLSTAFTWDALAANVIGLRKEVYIYGHPRS